MARKFARVLVSVWDDPDFVSLRTAEQHAYFAILSSRDISWCGVTPLLPQRFAPISADMTARKFTNALESLQAKRFVELDEGTAEILARSFVRHDDILRQPNVTKAMGRAFGLVRSESLQRTIIGELARAYRDDPEAKGWPSLREAYPDLFSSTVDKASRNPSRNPSRKAG